MYKRQLLLLSNLRIGQQLPRLFKQKTAYEMESRDWSSDVCSSDLAKNDEERSAIMAKGNMTIRMEPELKAQAAALFKLSLIHI